ncbi:Rha family transcriptional regulator [Ligilactobacillus salivarius]|uniref:Rha family transcriptional regulator n=1 Tax=Ligilactobacillus salivarius TaxID=1624 RepID=UPI001CBE0434|nr:Rha family transcriptional regulator [Ligilactobacillus salivarius]MBZ4031574.1 Rha family transcriptional regulator [Ligilactobacillus salivarius]
MLDLVFYTDNTLKAEPYTTSEIIANNTNNSRIAVRRLIEKHINRLKQFGKVEFEMQPLPSGQKAKVYKLNEQQATLLITFLDNSDIVANFKTLLVKQFYEMRDELTKRNVNRAIEKPVKKTLMESVKNWKYTSKHAYSNINRLLIKGATGLSINALKKERGDAKAALDLLTSQEQEKYKQLEQKVIAYIEADFDYQLIKALLTGKEIKFIYQGAMQNDKLTTN